MKNPNNLFGFVTTKENKYVYEQSEIYCSNLERVLPSKMRNYRQGVLYGVIYVCSI